MLRLFHTWPKEWDAEFTLLARGAFLVSATQKGGNVGAVEIVSQAGSGCELENPWSPDAIVTLTRDGKTAETLRGARLKFSTRKGERIVLASRM